MRSLVYQQGDESLQRTKLGRKAEAVRGQASIWDQRPLILKWRRPLPPAPSCVPAGVTINIAWEISYPSIVDIRYWGPASQVVRG